MTAMKKRRSVADMEDMAAERGYFTCTSNGTVMVRDQAERFGELVFISDWEDFEPDKHTGAVWTNNRQLALF